MALEQAAAYMRATWATLAEYLESFRQRRAEMLARGEPNGYSKTVATTWALAFGRLQQDTPGAVGLLRLMAFCAPEAIPLRLLLQPRPELVEQLGQEVTPLLAPLLADTLTARDAIAALRRYSLVTDAGDGRCRCIGWCRPLPSIRCPQGWLTNGDSRCRPDRGGHPGGPRQPQTWPVFRLLRPHADKALAPGSSGMERIASYLGNSGSYAAARDIQRGVIGAREQTLGPSTRTP